MTNEELQEILMKFYDVDSKDKLIHAQDRHIGRLQKQIKLNDSATVKRQATNPREG